MHRTHVKVLEDVLDANGTIARANRADFDREHVTVVNLMGSPGAGKTTVLEQVVASLPGVRVGVLEGDVKGTFDADRIAAKHVPVTQINTDPSFGGECHLDANMVRSAVPSLPLSDIDLLVIENVGNLVCPAEFQVGEHTRVMVTSVTEGEDKPLKYPLMFRACDLVLVNKIDLLPHLDVDMEKFLYHLDAVHPGVRHIELSAKTGEGIARVARLARADRDPRAGGGLTGMLAHPGRGRAARRGAPSRTSASSPPRQAASPSCAGCSPTASGRAAVCSPAAPRRRIARMRATSRSSSCTR